MIIARERDPISTQDAQESGQSAERRPQLTDKRWRFVECFVETGRGAEAARQAGYGERGARSRAYELLRRGDIQAGIAWYRRELSDFYRVDRDFIVGRLLAESMLGDDDGGSQIGRIRALEIICKTLGLFHTKLEPRASGPRELNLNVINEIRQRLKEQKAT